MEQVALDAGECALVAGLFLPLQRAACLGGSKAGVDRDCGLFVRKEDPVAVALRQLAPWAIHVITERNQDVALVLSAPRRWPRRDGALSNGERIIGHHRALGGVINAP